MTAPIAPGSAEVEQCVAVLQKARELLAWSELSDDEYADIDRAISLLRRLSDEGRDKMRMDWLDAQIQASGYAVHFCANKVEGGFDGCLLQTDVGSGPWMRQYLKQGAAREAIDSAIQREGGKP